MAKQKPRFKNNSGIFGIQSNTRITANTKLPKFKAGADLTKIVK